MSAESVIKLVEMFLQERDALACGFTDITPGNVPLTHRLELND